MTDAEILKLATEEPAVAATTLSALQRAVRFMKTRGAMLAALRPRHTSVASAQSNEDK